MLVQHDLVTDSSLTSIVPNYLCAGAADLRKLRAKHLVPTTPLQCLEFSSAQASIIYTLSGYRALFSQLSFYKSKSEAFIGEKICPSDW